MKFAQSVMPLVPNAVVLEILIVNNARADTFYKIKYAR